MTFYPKALPGKMPKTWKTLASSGITKDFYLAGGTALALRLGHRESIDLDFFSPTNMLAHEARRAMTETLTMKKDFQVEEEKDRTLHAILHATHISFFHYPYPLLVPTQVYEEIQVAGLEDIGLMKLTALAGRGSKKDFIDLFFLSKEISLAHLLQLSSKKFKNYRDFRVQALKALVYFVDAENEPMPRMHRETTWEQVKKTLEELTRKITKDFSL